MIRPTSPTLRSDPCLPPETNGGGRIGGVTPLEPILEAELVGRCAAGDEAAWDEFLDRYGPLLVALTRRMLSRRTGRAPQADVDEVVAEVLLALVRRERLLLHRFDPTYRLSTYLGVICRTHVLRHLRRGRRRPAGMEDARHVAADPAHTAPEQGLRQAETARSIQLLREALHRLPERDRRLLELRYLDGLDYRSIGHALAIHPESVGQLLHRAKRKLAKRSPELSLWVKASRGE